MIPQLDGHSDEEIETDNVKHADKEVQTEPEQENLKCPGFEHGHCDQEWFKSKFEWNEHRLKDHIYDEIIIAKRYFQFVLQGLENKSYLSARHDADVVAFLETRLQSYQKLKKV